MDINEPLAQRAEAIEGRGRTIYELPVGAGRGESALEDELIVFTCFQAVFLEEFFEGDSGDVEQRFYRTTLAAAADERAVRPLAQD